MINKKKRRSLHGHSNMAPTEKHRTSWSNWISLMSLIVAITAVGNVQYESWNARRAKCEKAEYYSYMIGVKLGICYAALERNDKASVSVAQMNLRDIPGLCDEIGLRVEIQGCNRREVAELALRVSSRIGALYGRSTVDSYRLGWCIGGAMDQYAIPAIICASMTSGSPVVGTAYDSARPLIEEANTLLKSLGFNRQIQMSDQSVIGWSKRLDEMDKSLGNAWEPREGRWRRDLRR